MGVGLDRAEVVDADHLDILGPGSAMARSTLRPMRPNPLIATRIAIQFSSKVDIPVFCGLFDRFLGGFCGGFMPE